MANPSDNLPTQNQPNNITSDLDRSPLPITQTPKGIFAVASFIYSCVDWLSSSLSAIKKTTRPGFSGFKHRTQRDEHLNKDINLIQAVVPKDKLISTFKDLVKILGTKLNVVLTSQHDTNSPDKITHIHSINGPSFLRILTKHSNLLLNDSMTSIAVLNPDESQQIELRKDKSIICFNCPVETCEHYLAKNEIENSPSISPYHESRKTPADIKKENKKKFDLLVQELTLARE